MGPEGAAAGDSAATPVTALASGAQSTSADFPSSGDKPCRGFGSSPSPVGFLDRGDHGHELGD